MQQINELEIRKATIDDASLLSRFAASAFTDAYTGTMAENEIQAYVDKSFDVEFIRSCLASPFMHFYIGLISGVPAGYTKLRTDRSRPELQGLRSIELERIYVSGGSYRKGWGSQLLNHAIEKSRSDGFDVMWLAVWQKNERAISFYKKAGMEIFGEQQFTVGTIINNDYVFRLDL